MDKRIQTYMQEDLNSAERLELLRQIEADEDLKKEFAEINNMKAVLNLSPLLENREEGKDTYHKFTKLVRKRNTRRIIIQSLKYAAVLALVILSTYWITGNYLLTPPTLIAENNTLFVPTGHRSQITLQDGTVVWLNARTTMVYPSHFVGNERVVTISGEAYFNVSENPEKPFIVKAGDNRIKVLGTEFNVFCYPDAEKFQTSLIEGSIELSSPIIGNQKVVLKPNQEATIEDGKVIVKNIPYFDAFLWKEGVYSFMNERLEDITKKLELYYDVKIIIKTPALKDIPYTGKFRQRESVYDVLEILSRIRPFEIEKNTDRSIITLN